MLWIMMKENLKRLLDRLSSEIFIKENDNALTHSKRIKEN